MIVSRYRARAINRGNLARGEDFQRLWEQLAWLYGPERTHAIFAGNDAKTNEDLNRWRAFGRQG